MVFLVNRKLRLLYFHDRGVMEFWRQSDNRKFRSSLLVGKNCTALYETLFDAGLIALQSISPGKGIYYGTLRCRTLSSKENFPRQRPALWLLRQHPYSAALSFPPRGMTGTSCYRFEYDLHLIKIPSHLDRENINNKYEHVCDVVVFSTQVYSTLIVTANYCHKLQDIVYSKSLS